MLTCVLQVEILNDRLEAQAKRLESALKKAGVEQVRAHKRSIAHSSICFF